MSPVVKPTKPQSAPKKGGNGFIVTGIIIIILAAAIGAAWYFGYLPFQKKPVPPPPPPPVEVVETDTTQVVQEDPIEAVVSEIVAETPAVRYDSDPNVEKGFYIIIGSYQSKRNAERFAKNMKADIETKVLFFEGSGLYRVSCGYYKNIHTAYNDRISILDLEGCSEAWILENR
jgi:cell division protein FtsN